MTIQHSHAPPFLASQKRLWEYIPFRLRGKNFVRPYGRMIHHLVRRSDARQQNPWTFFLRNRAEMNAIKKIAQQKIHRHEKDLRILVLACSEGMEIYSIAWQLRALEPHLNLSLVGLEIDQDSLDTAKSGVYPLKDYEEHMERLTHQEFNSFFDVEDGLAKIKPELSEGVEWHHGDACREDLADRLGKYDIVLANRFLCHMKPSEATRCLSNVTRLIALGGYLFVSGVDLDIRQAVMAKSGFTAVEDDIEAIHNGDPSLLKGWPVAYWGLEPFSTRRKDWQSRYAMVYQKMGDGVSG